jgi:hypothetical protein
MQKPTSHQRKLFKRICDLTAVGVLLILSRWLAKFPVILYTRMRGVIKSHKYTFAMLLLGLTLATSLGSMLLKPVPTSAATDNTINFQARLQASSGAIVPDGTYNIEFKLYSASSGGTALWTEDYLNSASQGVQTIDGYLSVQLGSITAFPNTINWDQNLYLGMNIGGTVSTGTFPSIGDGEMTPRLPLTAVPYAFKAGQLAQLTSGYTSTLGFSPTMTANNSLLLPNESGTLCVQGDTTNCGFAAATGSTNYVQNTGALQAGTTNFNISGTGTAVTGLTTPLLQSSSGALTVQGANGTVTLGSSTSLTASGGLTIASGGSNTSLALNTDGTGGINIGANGSGNNTLQIGNTSGAYTQTINIGTNATASSTTNLTVGSTVAGTLVLQGAGINQTISGSGDTVKSTSNSATALQVQNSSGNNILDVDTTNSQAILGKASSVNGTLQFANSAGANTVSLSLQANPVSSYSLLLPTTGPAVSQCLQTSSGTANQLTFASCDSVGAYINNQTGVQSSSNFNISGTGIAGTAFTTPLLQSAASTALTITGNATSTWSTTAGNLTIQAGAASSVLALDSGTSGTVNLGNTSASTINIGANNIAHTINIGNGGSTTTQTISLGSTSAASTAKLQAGATSETLTNSGDTIQTTTNSTTAFQVQDAVAAPVLLVDTTSTAANGSQLNYLTYPGFESGSFSNASAGWAAVSPATLAQNTTKLHTYNGLYSAQVTTTSSNGGLTTSSFISAPPTGTYIVSFYAKVSSGTMASTAFIVQSTDGTTHACSPASGVTINSSGFQRLYCSITTTAAMTALQITQNDGTARTIYIDAVQLQSNSFNGATITTPTPYQIGSIQLRGVINNPVTFMNNGDSTTAFQIQNATDTSNLFVADTLDSKIGIGAVPSSTGATLQIGGSASVLTTSTTAFQVQNAAGNNILDVDTTNNQAILGKASSLNGTLQFANAAGTNTVSLSLQANPSSSYTLLLPTAAPSTSQCLQTSSVTSNQLTFATCGSGGGSNITNGTTLQTAANFNIQSVAVGNATGQLRALASQTADLLDFENSSGSVISEVTAAGSLQGGNASGTNIAGTNLVIAGGQGTGTGAGGNINFNVYQAGASGSTNNTTAATALSISGSNGAAIFKNGTNSPTAFQVQNTAAVNVLNVDTANQIVSIQGTNSDATIGAEMMSSNTNFSSNWSGTGWTFSSSGAVHSSGTTPASYSGFTPSAYTSYQITYTFSGGNGADAITPSIGGTAGQAVYDVHNTDTQLITANNTNPLQFTPTTGWTGTITSVSVKAITSFSNPVIQLLNSAGNVAIEIRTSTTNPGNLFIGKSAGSSNATGNYLTVVGTGALGSNTSGSANDAFGFYDLSYNTTGSSNDAFGTSALEDNTSGSANDAFGEHTIWSNTTGSNNSAFGAFSLQANTNGYQNVAVGANALYSNTTGFYNNALGYDSQDNALNSINNNSFGTFSLEDDTTGSGNNAFGTGALGYNLSGSNNVAIGLNGLYLNTSGTGNVALGVNAGYTNNSSNANTTGSDNTYLGYDSGAGTATQLQNATAVGTYAVVNSSNALVLGCISGVNGCTTSTSVGIGTATPTATLNVVGSTLLQSSTNSTSAFQVQPSASTTPVLDVDTSNGRVGIGTATPGNLLDVESNANNISFIVDHNANAGSSSGASILLQPDSGFGAFIEQNSSTNTGSYGGAGSLNLIEANVANLTLGTSNTVQATIASGGAATFKNSANSTAGFTIQATSTVELTADTTNNVIHIGSSTTDTTQVDLALDQDSSFVDTGTCASSASSPNGAIYYNSNTNAVRACINGNWEDMATTSGLGIILFGVVPDSGSANQGDLGGVGGETVGPCKVYIGSTAATVSWTACTAYSGGRKVNITAATNQTVTGLTTGTFSHLCISTTTGQPTFTTASTTETANLPTFSANNPVLCLADIKGSAASTISNIYDTRTFTNTVKEFGTSSVAAPIGTLTAQTATANQLAPTTSVGQNYIRGVVVASNGAAATTSINVIIATSGVGWVKSTGTSSAEGLVTAMATAGYTSTVTTVPATAPAVYNVLGIAQRTISTSCAAASTTATTDCQYSQYVDIETR